jgi:hypothetical protein
VGEGHSGYEELGALDRALAGLMALRASERAELLVRPSGPRPLLPLEPCLLMDELPCGLLLCCAHVGYRDQSWSGRVADHSRHGSAHPKMTKY